MYLQNKYTKYYFNIVNNAKSRTLSKEIYTEKHHIIPKSLNGSNESNNLVNLTAREHFICHRLLTKMTIGIFKRNMVFAMWSMLQRDHSRNKSRYKINSHLYTILKIQHATANSLLHKGKIVSIETRKKISSKAKGRVSPNKGKAMSDAQKHKLSIAKTGTFQSSDTIARQVASRAGYKHSEETKKKIANSNKGKLVVISAETKAKISISLKGRPNANKGKPAFNRGIPHTPATILKFKKAHQCREKLLCPHCNTLIAKCSFTRWHGDNCKFK